MSVAGNKRIVQAFTVTQPTVETRRVPGQLAEDVSWTNIGSTKYSGTYVGKNDLVAKLVEPLLWLAALARFARTP